MVNGQWGLPLWALGVKVHCFLERIAVVDQNLIVASITCSWSGGRAVGSGVLMYEDSMGY